MLVKLCLVNCVLQVVRCGQVAGLILEIKYDHIEYQMEFWDTMDYIDFEKHIYFELPLNNQLKMV